MKASDESNVRDRESKTRSIHLSVHSDRVRTERTEIVVIDVVVSPAVSLTSRSRQRSPLIRKNFCAIPIGSDKREQIANVASYRVQDSRNARG